MKTSLQRKLRPWLFYEDLTTEKATTELIFLLARSVSTATLKIHDFALCEGRKNIILLFLNAWPGSEQLLWGPVFLSLKRLFLARANFPCFIFFSISFKLSMQWLRLIITCPFSFNPFLQFFFSRLLRISLLCWMYFCKTATLQFNTIFPTN